MKPIKSTSFKKLFQNNIYRIIFFPFCFMTFFSQVSFVTKQYLQYKTLTFVNFDTEPVSEIPIFVFDLPMYLPVFDILERIDPVNASLCKVDTGGDPIASNLNESCVQNLINRHFSGLESMFEDTLMTYKYFDQISQNFDELSMAELIQQYRFERLVKKLTISTCADPKSPNEFDLRKISKVVNLVGLYGHRSMALIPNGNVGTDFFDPHRNRTRSEMEAVRGDVECRRIPRDVNARIVLDTTLALPGDKEFGFTLLAPNNYVPSVIDMNNVDTDHKHILIYHTITVRKLPPPYATNCRDYRFDITAQSRTSCLSECIWRHAVTRNDTYGGLFFHFAYHSYFDENQFGNRPFPSVAEVRFLMSKNKPDREPMMTSCNRRCPDDCFDVKHQFSSIKTNLDKESPVRNNIMLTHHYAQDFTITHRQEVDFVTFLGTLGGLAGMWLGLSVYALFKKGWRLSVKIRSILKHKKAKSALFEKTSTLTPPGDKDRKSWQGHAFLDFFKNLLKRKESRVDPMKIAGAQGPKSHFGSDFNYSSNPIYSITQPSRKKSSLWDQNVVNKNQLLTLQGRMDELEGQLAEMKSSYLYSHSSLPHRVGLREAFGKRGE